MGMAHSKNPTDKLAREQARAILDAQAHSRTLAAWNVLLANGDRLLVVAVTDRGAASIARESGSGVVRVGPANVGSSLPRLIDRALAAVPAAAEPTGPSRAAIRADRQLAALCGLLCKLAAPSPGSSRDAARDWLLTGEGSRPALPAAPKPGRIAGMPRIVVTAQPRRRFVGQPIAGEYSLGYRAA